MHDCRQRKPRNNENDKESNMRNPNFRLWQLNNFLGCQCQEDQPPYINEEGLSVPIIGIPKRLRDFLFEEETIGHDLQENI